MKKNKENKTDKNIRTNNRINKDLTKQKTDINNNNKNEKETNIKTLQIQNANLKRLIEAKNGEIESLKVDNKKKNLLLMNHKNKIEKLKKKLDLIKVRNEILVKNTNEKDQQIMDLNNSLDVIKNKITPEHQKSYSVSVNKIKELIIDNINNNNCKENNNNNENLKEKIEKYEIELNKIKNNLDESEIKNKKLVFENNILVDKIKNIEKEKTEEIKILKTLHQKEIENYNKNISQLNEKIMQLLMK